VPLDSTFPCLCFEDNFFYSLKLVHFGDYGNSDVCEPAWKLQYLTASHNSLAEG